MKSISNILLVSGLIFISSCQNKQTSHSESTERPIGEVFAEAYQNNDWETVVSIGDTLIGEKDTMNLTIGYAEALAATGKPQKALIAIDKKLAYSPDDYYLYQTKGNVFCTMEQFDSAIACYEHVIGLNPNYARPNINMGEIYEMMGDKNNAIANYISAARLFVENDKQREAIEFAKRVLSLDSTNVEAKKILYTKQ